MGVINEKCILESLNTEEAIIQSHGDGHASFL